MALDWVPELRAYSDHALVFVAPKYDLLSSPADANARETSKATANRRRALQFIAQRQDRSIVGGGWLPTDFLKSQVARGDIFKLRETFHSS